MEVGGIHLISTWRHSHRQDMANSNSTPWQQTKNTKMHHTLWEEHHPTAIFPQRILHVSFVFLSHPADFLTLKSMTHCIAVVALSLEFQATTFARPWQQATHSMRLEQGSSLYSIWHQPTTSCTIKYKLNPPKNSPYICCLFEYSTQKM